MSRVILAVILVFAGTSSTVRSQTLQSDAPRMEEMKKQILGLDQQLNEAAVRGDMRFFSQVMSDGYVGVAPNGMILQPSLIAAHYQTGALHYESVHSSGVEVRIHGDCAILTAVSTVKGGDGDTDLSGTYRIMRVFLRRGGIWQIVAFQATPMRVPAE
ncbi:MAG: hypothetical protein NVS9B4_14580 [Candidatus Acidiferrum sp.]